MNIKLQMINCHIQIRQLSIGQLVIMVEGLAKYASCVLCYDLFALMPSYIMKNVTQDDCHFEFKNLRYQTIDKKKPIKILYSSNSSLSILIFQESQRIISLVKDITIYTISQQIKKANRQKKDKVYVHGYHIEYGVINGQQIYQSKRKSLNCPYRMIIDNQIHYDCLDSKNGMIGSALCLQDQKWIGIHQGGENEFGYGILFTPQVVQKIVALLSGWYNPQIRFLPPSIYFQNECLVNLNQQNWNLYQNMLQQQGQIEDYFWLEE